eukprot:scaffold27449_cov45-Phaeocystis_antarctica.AAC.2
MAIALLAAALIACTDVPWGGACGPQRSRRCSTPGQCCSCAVSAAHCAANQQAAYSYGGSCSAQAATPSPSPSPPSPSPPPPSNTLSSAAALIAAALALAAAVPDPAGRTQLL